VAVEQRTQPADSARGARRIGASRAPRQPPSSAPVFTGDYDARILFEVHRIYPPASLIPDAVLLAFARLTGWHELFREYDRLAVVRPEVPFLQRAIDDREIRIHLRPPGLETIPRSGPVIVYANHATGGMDLFALGSQILRVRSDLRVLTNEGMHEFPLLADMSFPVNIFRNAPRESQFGVRHAVDWLKRGGVLMIFPAAQMSLFSFRERRIKDRTWRPGLPRLCELVDRIRDDLLLLPAHIGARNSNGFYLAGAIHPMVALGLGPHEMVASRHRHMSVTFGTPFAPSELHAICDPDARTSELRRRSDALAPRH